MLKELIQHIQETALPMVTTIDGATFCITAGGAATEVRPAIDRPDTLDLHSLDSLVKMVRTEATEMDTPLYLNIPDHMTVNCFAQPDPGARFFRQVFYVARATDVPGWDAKVQLGFEEAQIALRTRFQETEDTLYTMKLLSDITCGAKITFNDNGVATTVVTKKGIDLQANETIRPIVRLKPYRTFQEVEQPESIFLIRVSDRGISFIEADGGMWKLKARDTVKAFLEANLAEEIGQGAVIVAL